jgi:alcohol dehydrogenase (cytochrome c)
MTNKTMRADRAVPETEPTSLSIMDSFLVAVRKHRLAALCSSLLIAVCPLFSSVAGHTQSTTNQPGSLIDIRTQDLEASRVTDNWLSYHGDYTGRRYSSLEQITPGNVSQMQLQWVFHSRNTSLAGVAPIVVGGVIYIAASNDAFAIDARTGVMLWRYTRPGRANDAEGTAEHVSRGVAMLGSRLYMVTDDAHLVCLDARSGSPVWETTLAVGNPDYGAPSAPLAIRDKIIVGVSQGQNKGDGFVAAFDAGEGKERWRFAMATVASGDKSPNEREAPRSHCGSAMWTPGTYDPVLGTLYWSTGSSAPLHAGDLQPDEEREAECIVALDPETGKLKWRSELRPHAPCDSGSPHVPMLVDITHKGSPRRGIIEAHANGVVDVIDRETGTILSEGGETCHQAVADFGWSAPAFNQQTHLLYFLSADKSMIHSTRAGSSQKAKVSKSAGPKKPSGIDEKATVVAYDPASEKLKWANSEIGANVAFSSFLTTAAGLLLYGDASQSLHVADAATGKPLWQLNIGQRMTSPPISYAILGKQYVVVAAGKDLFAFGLP